VKKEIQAELIQCVRSTRLEDIGKTKFTYGLSKNIEPTRDRSYVLK